MLIALLDPTPLLRPSFFSIGCGQEKFYYFTCNILTVRIATDKIMLALPVPPGRGVSLMWLAAWRMISSQDDEKEWLQEMVRIHGAQHAAVPDIKHVR